MMLSNEFVGKKVAIKWFDSRSRTVTTGICRGFEGSALMFCEDLHDQTIRIIPLYQVAYVELVKR